MADLGGDTTTNPEASPNTSGSALIFPGDLVSQGHFIRFSAFEYSRGTRGDPAAKKGQSAGHVILPMPDNLSTTYNAQYVNGELGVFGRMSAGATTDILGLYNKAKEASKAGAAFDVNKSVTDLLKVWGGKAMDSALGVAGYAVLDAFENTQVGMGAQVAGGFARNPHMALLFRGVEFRSHSFQYKLIARNAAESQTLYDICKFFKTWMLPSYIQGFDNNLFSYPYEFEIEFSHPDYLFHIGESVLTSFTPSYHATGKPLYFKETHAPVALTIEMSFTETAILTRESVTSAYNPIDGSGGGGGQTPGQTGPAATGGNAGRAVGQ